MKRAEPLRLDAVIQRMIDATGMRPEYSRQSVVTLWPDVVGKHIADYTGRIYVQNRILHVYIVSAVLKEELGYVRDQLVDKLNEAVGQNVIDSIIIH
ncbi:MAG: DUF721 domain-containing protein [Muribaculaceae bacterium]|nr:DUF721 domain-containing protein [Muribaculaceae bacterium]